MTAKEIKDILLMASDPEKKEVLPRFFKTGKGQYGEGYKFIGTVVPVQREIVKKYKNIEISEIAKLIVDEYHECRMTGLLFLVEKMKKTKDSRDEEILFKFYISHADNVNNWDLVDLTAPDICGKYFLNRDRTEMLEFSNSNNMWLQRISIVGTLKFIKNGDFETTLQVAKKMLHHKHDLIHKAVGWMLREVGKVDFDVEIKFLVENDRYKEMPRTMLRYAIEKFPEDLRQQFLKGKV